MRRLLILACGATKRHDPGLLPGIERYTGPPFRTLRATLRALDAADHPVIFILSAQYGLIRSETGILDYDLRLTEDRADALQSQVRHTLNETLITGPYAQTFINLGRDYLAALSLEPEMIAHLGVITYAKGGIGTRMAQMKAWLLGV